MNNTRLAPHGGGIQKFTLLEKKEVLSYGLVILLSIIILIVIYKLLDVDFSIPFLYNGDGIFYLGFVKGIVDNGWYLENEFLGAPGKSELYDFPMGGDNFQHLCFKVFSFFTNDYVLILNLYLLLTFPVTAVLSFFVFRKFNLSRKISLLLSLLYAFTPYHFFRGAGHLVLSGYYMIPLGIMLIILILNGKEIFFAKRLNSYKPKFDFSRRSIFATLICVLIASTGVYYAFFQSLMMGIMGIVTAFQKKNWLIFLRTATFCGIIFTVSVLNVAPSIFYQQKHGPNQIVAKRLPAETEYHGLRITQLLLPITGHRLASFSEIKASYNQNIGISENDWATLGILGSIGFIFLLVNILGKAKRHQYLLEPLSRLNVIALLFATIGGFGSLFSFLVMANFRAQNRISIIIAFIAIFSLGILLEILLKKVKWEWLKATLITALLIFGIWDQTVAYFAINQEPIKNQFSLEKRFVEKIEEIVPPKAMIYQLPYFRYPESTPIHLIQDYEMLKGYFHSKQLRWSYGVMKTRTPEQLIAYISSLDTEGMLNNLKKMGFSGIYIDRNGYIDQAQELEANLFKVLNITPIVSEDNRLSFFSLKDFNPSSIAVSNWENEIENFNKDNAVMIQQKYFLGDGWWPNEGSYRWTNGNKPEMLIFVQNPPKDLILNLKMFGFIKPTVLDAQRVNIFLNGGEIGKLEVSEQKIYSIRLKRELLNRSHNILTFNLPDATSPQNLEINNDTRILGLSVQTASLHLAQD